MKRSILFFASFALIVAPLDLQGEDAQENTIDKPAQVPVVGDGEFSFPQGDVDRLGGESNVDRKVSRKYRPRTVHTTEGPRTVIEVYEEVESAHENIPDELRDRLRANIDILRHTSKSPDDRAKARDAVRQILAEMFDADVARRREQIEKLRSQVSELTTQLDAREKSRDEMVKLRLLLLDQEVSGTKAFPKGWDVLSDLTRTWAFQDAAQPLRQSPPFPADRR